MKYQTASHYHACSKHLLFIAHSLLLKLSLLQPDDYQRRYVLFTFQDDTLPVRTLVVRTQVLEGKD